MDCSLSGSSIHGIFQARVLEWVAISFSRGSSWPRDRTQVFCIAGRHFTIWATREDPKQKPIQNIQVTQSASPLNLGISALWWLLMWVCLKNVPFIYLIFFKRSLESESEVTQSCLTLCDPMDYSLSGSSIHGIFQARVLEWLAISSSMGSSQPRNWTWVSSIASRWFYCLSHQESPYLLTCINTHLNQ